MHRGGALFLQGASNVSLSQLSFDQLEGNAVTLSNFVVGCSVVDCDFWRTGDSAVVAVGSTKLSNGTNAQYPHRNNIERNYFDTVGVPRCHLLPYVSPLQSYCLTAALRVALQRREYETDQLLLQGYHLRKRSAR